MDVFISWSGKTSGELAKVLRDWLPSVIQAVKPYFSEDDIEKGTRGNTVLAKELEEAGIGILCLTRENLEAPWIMFEAGSLSKSLDTSRVCPILFGDLSITDLKGPLTQFQSAKFNKEEIFKVIATINTQLGDATLETKILESVFEKWWPELEQKVKEILSRATEDTGEIIRKDRDLLEEILTLARQIPQLRSSHYTYQPLSEIFTKQELDRLNRVTINLLADRTPVDVLRVLLQEGYNEETAGELIRTALSHLQKRLEPSKVKIEETKSEVQKLTKTGSKKK